LQGGQGKDMFVLQDLSGVDTVLDFAGADRLVIDEPSLPIGNANGRFDNASTIAAPGGFLSRSELVIATADIAGALTAEAAAAAIGDATSGYAFGWTVLFVVDNGADTALFYFESVGADADVSAGELTLLATLEGTAGTKVADYLVGG
jgi:5-keto 4-deoxyuronate isomerase